ncbi:transcriptional regulator, XRE family with cupin sensor [Methanobrevibacter olleyae]|uniref:Transcriptional regulator n=2 Tax=Methanobrevibacter olleyae TaxID=294671 RepID=A0A126QYY2_METOL|nr:transcriptional regulator [Methanobrevibacter olleyae]SFL70245.1 transcriptional regulator, XRE family with cupin sensor [Methanobrevibacter olleyae]
MYKGETMKENKEFALKVKSIRERQNMSVEELAEKSDVKLDVLKAMESGEIIPSLTPLTKIAKALGVRLGTFLDDTPQLGPVLVRGGRPNNVLYFSGREDVTNASNLEFHSLGAGKIDRNIDPFIIDISYEEDYKLSSHEGEEFIYVLEGEIEVEYGKDKFTVAAGDSIFYDSVVPHHLHSIKDKAKILAVLYTPY